MLSGMSSKGIMEEAKTERMMKRYLAGSMRWTSAAILLLLLAALLDLPSEFILRIIAFAAFLLTAGFAIYLFWKYRVMRKRLEDLMVENYQGEQLPRKR